ncbi:hypothetical protein LNKW23_41960 [Paralimibaculum aggregatum]|uniref:MotA/TolQ/ExbB proton channel domain-containing protein n=1 Tax=Paralimibaculum aggregatum TaxID=3036245 RepID=A0ABQ6LSC4_9RHOB|nr:ABZJ_00895 family protein [Limibaculum sp. NKW23]GMG84980.1 hypothetical protein LNKW23_41960 [Limibaculum sp. NKW23]
MPDRRILRDHALALLAATIALGALLAGLAALGGPEIGGGIAVVPVLAATFFAGSRHAMRGGAAPRGPAAWRLAFALLGVTLLVSALLTGVWAALALGPEDRAALAAAAAPLAEPTALAVVAVTALSALAILLLGLRWIFAYAVGNMARSMARMRR